MKKRLRQIIAPFYFSFPVQLLLNHFKRNYVLLLCWLILFSIITGSFGNYLGIPYLFLDPVYINKVSFSSFFIIGITLACFSVAFHITAYINDGHRFTFVGVISKPFTVFSINNSVIPASFLITYIILIIRYQKANDITDTHLLFNYIGGLISGFLLMILLLYGYFWFTNKDIFKYVVCKLDEKLKQNIKATRASAMKKLNIAKKKQVSVTSYLNLRLKPTTASDHRDFYDKNTILQVFDQNHFNLVVIEILIVTLLFTMGIFRDHDIFQLPAAATFTLFLTIFVMFAGAFSYWFGSWSSTMAIIIFLALNFGVKNGFLNRTYHAFGLNYGAESATYNLHTLQEQASKKYIEQDRQATIEILNNWRAKFTGSQKPKMVFLCVSGGGQRAALWTLNALQVADSITNGQLIKNTMLITGASGGFIGASYYRSLVLEKYSTPEITLSNKQYYDSLGSDNLNSLLFSLLMNDTFVGFQKFEYNGYQYDKGRGYAFEQQLNENTNGILDHPLSYFKAPEIASKIPMMIMAPTIINDGRKLYISPQSVSYMMDMDYSTYAREKVNGIDFMRFFKNQGSADLRFLSGLRMNATFPYITPNITLPSNPALEIMDAGITDNFGISDAIRFLYTFRQWITDNTSGVIVMSIRDSQKNEPIKKESKFSLLEKFSLPISSIYQNFESLQDISNDNKIDYARQWFSKPIDRVDIEYIPFEFAKENLPKSDSLRMENVKRASLSWRLTNREKNGLYNNIHSSKNQKALSRLKSLLN